jgi:hypothetical protein
MIDCSVVIVDAKLKHQKNDHKAMPLVDEPDAKGDPRAVFIDAVVKT